MSGYFEPPPDWLRKGTTKVPTQLPPIGTYFINLVSNAVGFQYGAWTQIVAAGGTPVDAVLTWILTQWNAGAGGIFGFIDIGVGAGGAEVAIGTWGFAFPTGVGEGMLAPVVPPVRIPGQPRVAARIASSAGGSQILTALGICPTPL